MNKDLVGLSCNVNTLVRQYCKSCHPVSANQSGHSLLSCLSGLVVLIYECFSRSVKL